jgi:hypothetical protein
MILDSTLALDGPNFVPITVTRDSLNTIDLGVARDLGIGDPQIKLLIVSNRLFAGGTSVTVAFQGSALELSAYTTYAQSPAITTAQLNGADPLIFPIDVPRPPFPAAARPRFYKLVYTVVGTYTAGAVQAYLVLNRDDKVYYPSGFSTAGV